MKISFCSTCMNRSWQLEKTIDFNLKNIINNGHELCIVNFNSKDDCEKIILKHKKFIGNGLIYFKTNDPEYYSSSVAKNLSHRVSSNKILYNLDCDNFITKKEILKIEKLFEYKDNIIYHNYDKSDYGSFGRIAYKREDFFKIGGYDEELKGMGSQDDDLLRRFKKLNYKIITNEISYKSAIQNNKLDKVKNIEEDLNFKDISYRNMIISLNKIKNNNLYRNKNGMKKFNGYLNNKDEIINI